MTLFALTLACGPGTVTLGPPTADTGITTDDTGGSEEEPNAAAGDYSGSIEWTIPEYDWEMCEGELDLNVDDDGALSAEGNCVYEGNWEDYDLAIEVEGTVSEDGEVSGTISFDSWEYNDDWILSTLEGDLSGDAEDGELDIGFEAEAYMGDDGYVTVLGSIQGDIED